MKWKTNPFAVAWRKKLAKKAIIREARKEDRSAMTREIKFRAWDGKMIRGPISMFERCDQEVEKGKLMQFTGLKDKNGKEIYEGDVVTIDEVGKCRVDYLEHSMQFYFQTLEGHDKQFTATGDKVKVIGNIYENPELIEKV